MAADNTTYDQDMFGYHYLLLDRQLNIKIGFASDPYGRLRQYFSGYAHRSICALVVRDPFDICYELLGVRKGSLLWEKSFHARHKYNRVRGEWYRYLSPAYLEAISERWDKPSQHVERLSDLMRNGYNAILENILSSFGVDDRATSTFLAQYPYIRYDRLSRKQTALLAKYLLDNESFYLSHLLKNA